MTQLAELLNQYLTMLGCSAKDLANASGLSDPVISRYRKGERAPRPNSATAEKIIQGVVTLANERQVNTLTEQTIRAGIWEALSKDNIDYDLFTERFDQLISSADISMSNLAAFLTYDPSFLSRVRSGKRRPADVHIFTQKIAEYLVLHCTNDAERKKIAILTGHPEETSVTDEALRRFVNVWMCPETTDAAEADTDHLAGSFVSKLDAFDLDEYIRSIHFDELKVPTAPLQLPRSKEYMGIGGFKQMHMDMVKATVLSRMTEPVYFYSNLPIQEVGKDKEFTKKWMFGLAMMLRKNLEIHMLHDVNRPLPEMMMGLEGWIPLYMTGLVHPYYLPVMQEQLFEYLTFVSGNVAAEAYTIEGDLEHGRYYMTTNKKEREAFMARSKALFAKALPLMEIYRMENMRQFDLFYEAESKLSGDWHSLMAVMPLYTMSEDLLGRILSRNKINAANSKRLLAHLKKHRENIMQQLHTGHIRNEFPILSEEEFEKYPPVVSLSSAFYGQDVFYSYEEYTEHLALTRQFAEANPNYDFRENREYPFRNIQITLREGRWTLVSKSKSPSIHFVIRHPQLRSALEQLAAAHFTFV